jgi:RNA polymerase sigma-70 factor (ECF subfamily)
VALLTAMNVRRRDATRKRMAVRQDVAMELFASSTPQPDAELAARALAKAMRELLDALPLEQAEVLGLHVVLGYTVREIADSSRVPAETVRSRLRLAKEALRRLIAGDPQLGMLVGDEA